MATSLTKHHSSGKVFTRRPRVEAQIEEALGLNRGELQLRLSLTRRAMRGYLCSECLVHLIRDSVRSGKHDRADVVIPVLLQRCEANLRSKIPDGMHPYASELRAEILGRFGEMLASDGTGDNPDKLDFYEVRFNKAFRSFRLDILDQEIKRRKRFPPLPGRTASQEAGTEEDVLSRLSPDLRTRPTQEDLLFRKELLEAITDLPEDERTAVTLRIKGYQIESSDPSKETIATHCNCTGRTVRNRLRRVRAKLARFKEKP